MLANIINELVEIAGKRGFKVRFEPSKDCPVRWHSSNIRFDTMEITVYYHTLKHKVLILAHEVGHAVTLNNFLTAGVVRLAGGEYSWEYKASAWALKFLRKVKLDDLTWYVDTYNQCLENYRDNEKKLTLK